MFSLEAIEQMNQEYAEQAREERIKPYVVDLEELEDMPPFPFPVIGYHVPSGWKRADNEPWFVDSSGFGADDEPALSVRQFLNELRTYVEENPTHGFAIIEHGQFQVYVAAFRPVAA